MAISQDRLNMLLSSGEEMFRDDVTPDIERIAGLFPRGYISVVASMAGAGKTWLMQYLACKLSIGGNILDGVVARSPKYKSLILAGETGKKLLDKRLAKTNWEYEPRNIKVYEAQKLTKLGIKYMLNTPEGQENIAAIVNTERPTVLWVDTFLSFHTVDESKMAEMNALFQFLLRMAGFYNLAIVLNHHTRKKPNSTTGEKHRYTQDDVIGSSTVARLSNAVFIISVEDLGGGRTVQTVTNVKNWDKKVPPFTYEFIETDEGYTDFKIGFDTEGNNIVWSTKTRLRDYIASMAEGTILTIPEICAFLHIHQDTARLYLEEYAKKKEGHPTRNTLLEKITFMGKVAYRVL